MLTSLLLLCIVLVAFNSCQDQLDFETIDLNNLASEKDNNNTLYDGNGNQILPKGKVANSSAPCD